MATARELLAQADALMRRNRLRDAVRSTPPEDAADFPVLTEVIGLQLPPTTTAPTPIDIEHAIDVAELETEAAVAAATEAALAREAAAGSAGAPCAPVADAETPPLPGDAMIAVEGPEATSAVAPLVRDTASAEAEIGIPADALSLAPATAAVVDRAAGVDDFPVLTEVVAAPADDDIRDDAGGQVTWAVFDDSVVARDAIAGAGGASRAPPASAIDAPSDEPSAAAQMDELSPEDAALIASFLPKPDGFEAASEPIETPVAELLPDADVVAIAAPATAVALVAAAATGALAPAQAASAVPPVVAAPSPADAARWNALAEEIRMQVLQRIDIFTDTGLQEQLAARLQPIVDRASADLVATINQQIGALLRAYVAEAIEREIDRWREDAG